MTFNIFFLFLSFHFIFYRTKPFQYEVPHCIKAYTFFQDDASQIGILNAFFFNFVSIVFRAQWLKYWPWKPQIRGRICLGILFIFLFTESCFWNHHFFFLLKMHNFLPIRRITIYHIQVIFQWFEKTILI